MNWNLIQAYTNYSAAGFITYLLRKEEQKPHKHNGGITHKHTQARRASQAVEGGSRLYYIIQYKLPKSKLL